MPLTAKCLQLVLTDTSCPWNPISSFSPDVSTIPVHVSARSVRVHIRHRARTSRSIHVTPSTRVTWTTTQLLLFVLRFLPKQFVPLNFTFPKQITWDMLKKKKEVGTPRVVSGRRRPHASYAPEAPDNILQSVEEQQHPCHLATSYHQCPAQAGPTQQSSQLPSHCTNCGGKLFFFVVTSRVTSCKYFVPKQLLGWSYSERISARHCRLHRTCHNVPWSYHGCPPASPKYRHCLVMAI